MTQSQFQLHFEEEQYSSQSRDMIRGAFAIVLAIILLVISVSGFFILLISNDCNIFYPAYAPSANHLSHSSSSLLQFFPSQYETFFYHSTLWQLVLMLAEVLISLVIINNNNTNQSFQANDYSLVEPSTSRATKEKPPVKYTGGKYSFIFALKLIFILLLSSSLLLRLVTSITLWSFSLAPQSQLPSLSYISSVIISGASNASSFNCIIYATSLVEVLLFALVLSSSTQMASTRLQPTGR